MTQKKIKIVFGVNDFLVGGMQRQFAEQLKFFDRERFDIVLITLFTFSETESLYAELPTDLEVHRLDFRNIADIHNLLKLRRLLKRSKPDIVVSSLFASNTVFRILKPFVGYVSIAREHNTYNDRSLLQRFTDRMLALLSYRIVAVSTMVADYTAKYDGIPRERFVVIHNGIDIRKVRAEIEGLPSGEELRHALGFQPKDKILLNVSRLVPQKNHRLLIDGFALLHKASPQYKLAIVGTGTLEKELVAQARERGVGDAVVFFGLRHDVWKFYKISDAFVATSDIEGLSNSYLEALAAGLPLVATKTGGTDELIEEGKNGFFEEGKNGFFIDETTPEGVANIMRKLDTIDASAYRSAAQETAERFDIRKTVAAYERLFTDATTGTGIKALLKPLWNSPGIFRIRIAAFKAFEALTGYSIERKKFKKKVGYELDLRHPQSLNQKMVWKKIYDRNPLIPLTSDKYLVREYVKETLGIDEAGKILVPLLYVTDDPETIPFDTLPEEYIIKTNHDSGGNIIVRKGEIPDRKKIIAQLKKWMSTPYGVFKHEWGYEQIRRKVIIEKLIRGEDGDLAQDYKFHMFNGKCRFIHTTPKVNGERSGKRSLFTPEWKLLPVGWKHAAGPDVAPPPLLSEMVRIAEKLAAPFDYVRVDLYYAAGRVYFGELTHYHGGGMERFDPGSFDFEAGKWWDIVPDYWMKDKRHGV